MKILIVQDWLRSGGTERQSILLANAFAAAGHPATLLTFRPGGPLASTVAANVARPSLQPFDLRLDWFAPGLLRAVRRITPDVVLCMGRMANCHAGRIQHAFPAVAVIATMRTGKALPLPFRRSLPAVTHVIANSQEAAAELTAQHGVAPARIAVIHNSLVFPDDVPASRREILRREHGARPETVVLLCVAMFRPEKNQRELVEIASALPASPPWQLWLAGDGPARAECEQLAAARGLADRVRFLGFQRDPSALYAAAEIAVHASRNESLSNFLIEAQAHGLPVVACEARGVAECFVPGVTGWTAPHGDRAGFLGRLRPLMAEPSLRQACAPLARAHARQNFDARRQVQAHLDLFERLGQGRRAS
ncbi:MAG: glycosyl transferase group 1 [Verrucomicrobia bacterium]|nr:glycosyl transferase group 1 [Verrucomicrobiota bacterium]